MRVGTGGFMVVLFNIRHDKNNIMTSMEHIWIVLGVLFVLLNIAAALSCSWLRRAEYIYKSY